MEEKLYIKSRREFIKMNLGLAAFTLVPGTVFSSIIPEDNYIGKAKTLNLSSTPNNDLFELLRRNQIKVNRFDTPYQTIVNAPNGSSVIITSKDYPHESTKITESLYEKADQKKLRIYIEYPQDIPGINVTNDPVINRLGRGVITSSFFKENLNRMDLLGINDCHIFPVDTESALISFAKVAGFDRAVYGLTETQVFPLLFQKGNLMISMTALSIFETARYGPKNSWKTVWNKILGWLLGIDGISLSHWNFDPISTHSKNGNLPEGAKRNSIIKGAEWIFNAHFLIHPNWEDMVFHYLKKKPNPYGPPVGKDKMNGNGSLGVLEGHASIINYDGTQKYRYGLRADVQGEVAFLLASAGDYLNKDKYKSISKNLINYVFHTSIFRQGERDNKESSVYGLLGWTYNYPHVFYSDDNARSILGVIGASALIKNKTWDRFIIENILANFRLSSKQGFFGGRLQQEQIEAKGWKYFNERDFVYFHPHYESWMWACYLWLYDKTGYKPLLDKAKIAIRLTMEAYPDKWGWQNGIQQEKARMILPLAWLVRVDNAPQHQEWLKFMADELLKYQDPCGAIREELGRNGAAVHSGPKSNSEYGTGEAPLISKNGEPVSDMLYTCNFAFFALNEAAHATKDRTYIEARRKLSDFLTRIQVKSNKHKDLDGGWFRAFEYNRWDYWASNADSGWGVWSTLTGWIQNWIVSTQVLVERNQSYWELTKHSSVNKYMEDTVQLMFKNKTKNNK